MKLIFDANTSVEIKRSNCQDLQGNDLPSEITIKFLYLDDNKNPDEDYIGLPDNFNLKYLSDFVANWNNRYDTRLLCCFIRTAFKTLI